jgi:peptidoglycan hydrolase-like protein with peptidoglycan-binding domain
MSSPGPTVGQRGGSQKASVGDKSGLVGGLIPDPVDVLKDRSWPPGASSGTIPSERRIRPLPLLIRDVRSKIARADRPGRRERSPLRSRRAARGLGPSLSPTPDPEPAFEPPGTERQPTLRKGDKSGDGWVEYLQETLNIKLHVKLRPSPGLAVSGVVDDPTLKAVIAFQKQEKLQVDGIARNQTWAALCQRAPEKPSTFGARRTPLLSTG